MIEVPGFEGRTVAVFGLARSGLAAARALQAGGAQVAAWDDNLKSREAARAATVPGTLLLVVPASAVAAAFNDLVNRLEAGTELQAERVDPSSAHAPKIVSYRGHTRID